MESWKNNKTWVSGEDALDLAYLLEEDIRRGLREEEEEELEHLKMLRLK